MGGALAKETEPTQMGVPADVIKVGDFVKTISLSSQWDACRGRVIHETPNTFKVVVLEGAKKTRNICCLREW